MTVRPFTSKHPDSLGNGSLRALISNKMKRSSTDDEYTLGLSYITDVSPGGTPKIQPTAGTIQVAGEAAANTAVITLRVENKDADGDANTDVSFTITVAAAKVAWAAGAASAYTLKDVIDLINEDDAGGTSGELLGGFKAWVLDAPYDSQVNAANFFADQAETYIMPAGNTKAYTKAASRDVSAHNVDSDEVFYMRLGLAESRDRGLMKFIDIFGTVTGETNGTAKIYRDDYDDFVEPVGTYATDVANHDQMWAQVIGTTTLSGSRATNSGYAPDPERAEVWQGPLVLEIKSDDVTAIDLTVLTQAVNF